MHKKEMELLYSINHENIMKIFKIQIKRVDFGTYSFDILMEKAEKDWITEIRQRIKAKKFYKESEIISILKQVVKGLSFLQKNKIAHRDVKPQNILIFPNNIFKMADFGEADNINNFENSLTLRGSELYMSPILYEGHKHYQKKIVHNPYKSDVFSLGYCTLFAMTLGIQLLDNIREIKDMKIITSMINRYVNKNLYSNKFISLILKMIQYNESQRFDFIELENVLERYKI
jgi:serine/threonine protein kinase